MQAIRGCASDSGTSTRSLRAGAPLLRPDAALVFCGGPADKSGSRAFGTMYELVSLVNALRARGGLMDGVRKPSGRAAKAERAPTRTQDPEGTRQNIIEIASEEFALNGLVRRPHRRDRRPHPLQQAHDLLLFRRQGGPLSQRPGERLSPGARGRSTARHRGPAPDRGAANGWSNSPSTIITSMKTSSAW